MLRREAISLLAGMAAGASKPAPKSLSRFFGKSSGTAILLDVKERQILAIHNAVVAANSLKRPGSTVKPFTIRALLRAGKLTPNETYFCEGKLTIGDHSLNCSHPLGIAIRPETAIAYSCNCFIAHMGARLRAEELADELARAGFSAGLRSATDTDSLRLQSLGEDRVLTTTVGLALAYRALAIDTPKPIVSGLEGAVEYGTGQLARVPGVKIAGKTGSVGRAYGIHTAWFAGFAPSRKAEVAIAVMLQGRSGGSEAAPIAGRILEAWRARQL